MSNLQSEFLRTHLKLWCRIWADSDKGRKLKYCSVYIHLNINKLLTKNIDPLSSVAPSSAPGSLQGSSTSSTSIKVTWKPPTAVDHNGVLTFYTVYYQAAGYNFTNNTLKGKKVAAPLTEAILTGLEPFVEYIVKVSASTAAAEGPVSISIVVRTTQAGKKEMLTGVVVGKEQFDERKRG